MLKGRGHQIPVLKEEQDGKVEHQSYRHGDAGAPVVALLLAPRHDQSRKVVQHDGEDHQQDIHRLAPAVEHQVAHQQHQVAQLQRRDIVQQQDDGQIEEQEVGRGEDHRRHLGR